MAIKLRRWLILHIPTWLHPALRHTQFALTALVGAGLRKLPGSSRLFGPPRCLALTLEQYVERRRRTHPGTAVYKEIYPSHLITRSVPRTLDSELHPEFYKEMERMALPAGVAAIDRGRVVTATGTVIAPEDTFIADVSETSLGHTPAAHPVFLSARLPPVTRVDGAVAVVTTYFCNIYYHWIIDALPRFHLLQRSGMAYDKIVVPAGSAFQRESLRLLGIEAERIISAPGLHIEAEQLIVPSLPGLIGNAQGWACQFIRDTFLKHVSREARRRKRVYVSRANAGTRQFTNEPALWAVLEEFGFTRVFLEDLAFLDQVQLFHDAEIVVAAHGSGLTNLVFCRPGTTVIEIFSPNYMNVMYWSLSNVLKLNYCYVRGVDPKGFSPERGRRVHEDITVNISQVRQLIDSVLARTLAVS